MIQVRAKKHLGQHFLTDLQIALNIVESLPSDTTSVLEIGPGTGVLTQFLINKSQFRFSAVEIDSEAGAYLKEKFPSLHLIEGDFLKMNLKKEFGEQPFSIIGNFPYNISSQIFFKILDNRDQIPCVVGMVQKEVAERIAARHGNKTYGITSVLLQAFYTIEYLFTVSEHVFDPPPKVKSAVTRLTRNSVKKLDCNETCSNVKRPSVRSRNLKTITKWSIGYRLSSIYDRTAKRQRLFPYQPMKKTENKTPESTTSKTEHQQINIYHEGTRLYHAQNSLKKSAKFPF